MSDLTKARRDHTERSVRWGFVWALWCAVLWGAWYVPGTAIWYEAPFNAIADTTRDFLMAAAVITALNAIAVLLAMYVWVAVLGKMREYGRTIRQMRKVSKWFFAGAVFGGPMAIFGSFLAIGYVGGVFAAVAALLYPIVGAGLARVWYAEKITTRAALGILVIVGGGLVVYAPGILAEMTGTGTGSWLGYVGGIMAATGWGIEGAFAGRALDVVDPDVGLTIRFTAEVLYWVVLILPVTAILTGGDAITMLVDALHFTNLVWLLLAGLTFGFCYVSWYKSFPLIGVGRGQAIADFYGVFAIIFLGIFTLTMPDLNFLIGGLIVIAGGVIMYTERRDVLEVIRSVSHLGGSSENSDTAGS
ncbi:MAG: DMT family transporter [Actinobacteria bacterium]|nr:DMT family transporter [Actinomycetota bacterium]